MNKELSLLNRKRKKFQIIAIRSRLCVQYSACKSLTKSEKPVQIAHTTSLQQSYLQSAHVAIAASGNLQYSFVGVT